MRFDTVLFEFDGVLADTHAMRRGALARSLADDGVALADAAYDARRFDDTALDLVALRADRYFAEQLGRGLTLAPGARELVESLAGRVRLGVVTRAARREVEFVLGLAGLDAAFECVVAAEDVHSPKPSPEAYQQAFERLARTRPALPAATLALEDAPPGIIAAQAHKLRCVAVGPMPPFHAVQADAYLPSLVGQSLASLQALLEPPRRDAAGGAR